jgi:hypothetical protein
MVDTISLTWCPHLADHRYHSLLIVAARQMADRARSGQEQSFVADRFEAGDGSKSHSEDSKLFVEKHGALWPEGDLTVFEQFDAARQLLGTVFERAGVFTEAIYGKAADPQWPLPIWSELRPTSLLSSRVEAIDHVQSRLAHGCV